MTEQTSLLCRYVFMYAVHYFFAKTKMSGFFQVCCCTRCFCAFVEDPLATVQSAFRRWLLSAHLLMPCLEQMRR